VFCVCLCCANVFYALAHASTYTPTPTHTHMHYITYVLAQTHAPYKDPVDSMKNDPQVFVWCV